MPAEENILVRWKDQIKKLLNLLVTTTDEDERAAIVATLDEILFPPPMNVIKVL
jgi:hypothetical protein